ncbi:MAG: two-component sensor histidine kinase [Desulfobacterales bacterium]|nr:two-component sensor histidine kinase [Desulfobacterales bacterium]
MELIEWESFKRELSIFRRQFDRVFGLFLSRESSTAVQTGLMLDVERAPEEILLKGNLRNVDEEEALRNGLAQLRQRISSLKAAKGNGRRLQEALNESEKMAMAGKLASSVAHSIRNPLTSVKMRLFSLKRLNLPPAQKDDLEVISEEIGNIDNIVQNFLEFSRPPKLSKQKASPSDVVDAAVRLFRDYGESNGVEVTICREDRLPEILVDATQLKEALLNLLFNGGEAVEEGDGSIVIREEEGVVDPLGRAAIIKVSDNGTGIPEVLHEKLFQPFLTTKETGTGLGLSIAKRIVDEHGGKIDLHSRDGAGTTFVITLPFGDPRSLDSMI